MKSKQLVYLAIVAPLAGAAALVSCNTKDPTAGEDDPGEARFAVAEPTVITDILGLPSGATSWIHGRAEPGTQVSIYSRADCIGGVVATGTVDNDGKFAVAIPPPGSDTEYSAKSDGQVQSCSDPIEYHTVHHECPALPPDRPVTRTAIPIQQSNGYFAEWAEGAPAYTDYVADLVADPPALQYHYDTPAALPIDTAFKGAVTGYGNALWGEASADEYLAKPPLPPAQLITRVQLLGSYLATYQGVTQTAQYGDFGTQLWGDHENRTGFWEFYDDWKDYDTAVGLGGQVAPPDPSEWLRRHWDPDYLKPPPEDFDPLPDKMKGLSFEYWPQKGDSGLFRYSVDILSEGFNRYWEQVVRHSALAGYEVSFFDNAGFRFCWNQDCEDGYQTWLSQHFGQAEIDRYMTYVTSRDEVGTFDLKWVHQANGTWTNVWFVPESGAIVKPSTDAIHGPYSGHIDGPGLARLPVFEVPGDLQGVEWRYYVNYKTTCVNASMFAVVDHGSGGAMEPSVPMPKAPDSWTPIELAIEVSGATKSTRINFDLGIEHCELWIDDVTLHPAGEEPVVQMRLARNRPGELDDTTDKTLGAEATMKFWDSAVDDRLTHLRNVGRSVNPDYDIYVNSGRQRRGAGYFMVEEQLLDSEAGMVEVGSSPGVYMPSCDLGCTASGCGPDETVPQNPCRCQNFKSVTEPTLITNVFDYKLAHEWRFNDEFAYLAFYEQRKASYYLYTPEAALLHLAEGAAFGGGAALDLQLEVTQLDYPHGSAIRQDVVGVRHDFYEWVHQHEDLYRCLESTAPVGLVIHDVPNTHTGDLVHLGNSLFEVGLPYDIVSETHVDLADLQRFRAIVYHHVERIPAAEAAALTAYLQGGGIVFLSGSDVAYDDHYRLWPAHAAPAWPPVSLANGAGTYSVGAGFLIFQQAGFDATSIKSALGGLNVVPSLSAAQAKHFRTAFWKGPRRTVIHLVNYDTKVGFDQACHTNQSAGTLEDVVLNIPMPTPNGGGQARVYSPENGVFQGTVPVTAGPYGLTLTVPDMHLYSVVVLE